MKRIIAAFALTLFCAGSAVAGTSIIVLPAKNGDVTFAHTLHQEMRQEIKDMSCATCHETETGGKIAALSKEWAHKTCLQCHEKKDGPTKCDGCHKK